jgi:adenine specific DNA methylase Mod
VKRRRFLLPDAFDVRFAAFARLTMNTPYYGDNLKILRDYINDESVDLIHLDPPFNSNRNYNVLFRNESGSDSESQITAFGDMWHCNIYSGDSARS